MTPTQARHLLALIADLYALASQPEGVTSNGVDSGRVAEKPRNKSTQSV